jgi:2-amino-4-hydroxy-6-hydroxymethyldihydropteridine diphosphokinase
VSAVLSIGSNLGDRLDCLQLAVDVLRPYAVSPVYETAPVGGVEQDDFLNAVLLCDLDAAVAWARAQQAEQAAERERPVRWGPRTLDVDLVVAPGPVPEEVELPHPRAAGSRSCQGTSTKARSAAMLPGHGPVASLLGRLDLSGVRRRPDLALLP